MKNLALVNQDSFVGKLMKKKVEGEGERKEVEKEKRKQ